MPDYLKRIWKKSGLVEQEGNFLLPMASNELDQLGMEWERVFRNVKKDKETVEKGQGRSIASVTDVLGRIEGDNNDYTDFLMKFAKLQEEVRVNDDEFDYIYYTYGMCFCQQNFVGFSYYFLIMHDCSTKHKNICLFNSQCLINCFFRRRIEY